MLFNLKETITMIQSGKNLHIAADESLLAQLPKGNWIGGSTPYFMAEDGGVVTEDQLCVQTIDAAINTKTSIYDVNTIDTIGIDAYDNGFTILILPFGSTILEKYAKDAPSIDQIFMKNITGWVSGFNLGKSGVSAKVINGQDLTFYEDKGIALHIELPQNLQASIGIINIFEPDETSATITFSEDSFEIEDCFINGIKTNLVSYINENNIDTKLPLVANYSGSNINISLKEIKDGKVFLYAPVFEGISYKYAKKIGDYAEQFHTVIKENNIENIAYSCNCILNFLYGELEGKKTAPFYGQVTFGEIAYQLVNQTLVYVRID